MINFDRAEKAAEFIRDNAERYGQLIGLCKSLEHTRKIVFGKAFLNAVGNNVAEREAKAHASPEFKAVVEDIQNAWAEKETIATKIKAAELTIELYRSGNAAIKRIESSHR
jgi:hypothetical protein